MDQKIETLNKIIINFKKAGNRKYTEKTLRLKIEEINILDEQVKEHNRTEEIKEEDLIRFNKLKLLAKELLENALASMSEDKNIANTSDSNSEETEQATRPSTSLRDRTETNMSNFNLETSLKVIPEFTGNYKELPAFLKIVDIIYNSLAIEAKTTLIDFVLNVKLTPSVRTALGTVDIKNHTDLKNALQNRYKTTKTVAQIQSTLSNYMQKNLKVQNYNEKLLQMIAELNELQISEIPGCNEIQKGTIISLNNSYALNIFKNGLNADLKPTIFASRPRDLNEAVQLAQELEKDFSCNENQVLYFSNKNNKNNNRAYRTYNNGDRNSNYNRTYDNRNNKQNRNNNNYHRNSQSNNGNSRLNNNYNNVRRNQYNNNNNNNPNNDRRNRNNNSNNNYRNNNNFNRNRANVHVVQENSEEPEMNNQNVIIHHPVQN